jgi:putative chitinase
MSDYTDTLTSEQKENLNIIIERLSKKGITNQYMIAGILAVTSKESKFIPQSERGYGNTSNGRIRSIFGSRVSDLTDTQLTELKKNDKAFFDKIYGGRYGNASDEGYKYRGRGLNQLTFKGNYERDNANTDADIVSNPESVNNIEVAADALYSYFERNFSSSSARLGMYNMTNINDAKNTDDAVRAAFHANAGWGKSKAQIERDATGGLSKVISRVDDLHAWVVNNLAHRNETTVHVDDHVDEEQVDGDVYTVNVRSTLNLRKGPGTDYPIIGSLKKGQQVVADEDWVYVEVVGDSSKSGFVSRKYLDKT